MMTLKPIITENDYNKALKRLDVIFDSEKNTPEGDEMELLGMLIEKYEKKHYPILMPDINTAI